jgi:hypothetical protein
MVINLEEKYDYIIMVKKSIKKRSKKRKTKKCRNVRVKGGGDKSVYSGSDSTNWSVYDSNSKSWHKIYFENGEPKIVIDDDRKIADIYVDNGSTIVSLPSEKFNTGLFVDGNLVKNKNIVYTPLTCFLNFFPGLLNKYDDVANPSCVVE